MLILMLAAMAASTTPATMGSSAFADPLAPARAGKLLCQTPNAAAKTCLMLTDYSFGPDGQITNRYEVMLTRSPWLNIKVSAPVRVKDGAVCGLLEGTEKAEVFTDGKPADAETTTKIRDGLQQFYSAFRGKDACTSYTANGDFYDAALSIGGVASKGPPDRVIWVDPADGWAVKP